SDQARSRRKTPKRSLIRRGGGSFELNLCFSALNQRSWQLDAIPRGRANSAVPTLGGKRLQPQRGRVGALSGHVREQRGEAAGRFAVCKEVARPELAAPCIGGRAQQLRVAAADVPIAR